MNAFPLDHAEQLSALADGRLEGAALQQALQACAQDPAMLARWRDYHLIGEVLRGEPLSAASQELDFLSRLRPHLQPDPVVSLPPAEPAVRAQAIPLAEAANEPRFHWRWAAAVASLALAVGVGWSLVAGEGEPTLALGETPVLVTGSQGVMIRDAALEELMEAHREQADASALPMPSGFLRNATFESTPASLPRSGVAPGR